MNDLVLVGLGGTAGALARHALGERIDTRTRDTLAVNVLGSLLLGAILGSPTAVVPPSARLFVGVGFCGAFTTFSTFAFETVRLFERGELRTGAVNAAINLIGALSAVVAGAAIAGWWV